MGQQTVNDQSIVPEDEERNRLRVACIGSAEGTETTTLAMLRDTWGKQPVAAVLRRLKHTDVLVTNQKDKQVQLGRLEQVSQQLAACYAQNGDRCKSEWSQALKRAELNPGVLTSLPQYTCQRDFMLALLRRASDKAAVMRMVAAELQGDLDFLAEAASTHPETLLGSSSELRLHEEVLGMAAQSPALRDGRPAVRCAAVKALGQLGGPSHEGIIAAARAGLQDEDQAVRKSAQAALAQLIGREKAFAAALAQSRPVFSTKSVGVLRGVSEPPRVHAEVKEEQDEGEPRGLQSAPPPVHAVLEDEQEVEDEQDEGDVRVFEQPRLDSLDPTLRLVVERAHRSMEKFVTTMQRMSKDCSLDMDTFEWYFQRIGVEITPEESKTIWQHLDNTGGGKVSLEALKALFPLAC